MQIVLLKRREKELAKDYLKSQGFDNETILYLGTEDNKTITSWYGKQVAKAVSIYNKKSFLLKLDTAVDVFFGWIAFRLGQLWNWLKNPI
jgi:ubiquitin-protein ligase